MKNEKTPWLFAATVVVFWLALFFVLPLQESSRPPPTEFKRLTYKIDKDVNKLYIDNVNYLHYQDALIEFTNDTDIKLLIKNEGPDKTPQNASDLIYLRGKQLVLQKFLTDDTASSKSPSWTVKTIYLPLTITNIHSNKKDIHIISEIAMPKLILRSNEAGINVEKISIDKLNIYSNNSKNSGSIFINGSDVKQLHISSCKSPIRIDDSSNIQNLEIHSNPNNNLDINQPIENISRIRWKKLDGASKDSLCNEIKSTGQNDN